MKDQNKPREHVKEEREHVAHNIKENKLNNFHDNFFFSDDNKNAVNTTIMAKEVSEDTWSFTDEYFVRISV